jgi:hypothetical protein
MFRQVSVLMDVFVCVGIGSEEGEQQEQQNDCDRAYRLARP